MLAFQSSAKVRLRTGQFSDAPNELGTQIAAYSGASGVPYMASEISP